MGPALGPLAGAAAHAAFTDADALDAQTAAALRALTRERLPIEVPDSVPLEDVAPIR